MQIALYCIVVMLFLSLRFINLILANISALIKSKIRCWANKVLMLAP